MNQYRRICAGSNRALQRFNNHLAGLILVLAVNFLNGHQPGAGDRAINMNRRGWCPRREDRARHCDPDRRMAGMGMHDPADLRIAAIGRRQMGRGIGRRFLLPSTTLPLAISTTTARIVGDSSHSTPEGLMTISLRVSSTALTR